MDLADIVEVLATKIEALISIDLRAPEWRDWDRFVKDTFKDLKQPKRPKLTMDELGIKPDGGQHNIMAVYNAATADERAYWADWYLQASGVVHDIAARQGYPIELVAAVTALISPGSKWWLNARTTDQFLTFWKACVPVRHGMAVYPTQLKKLITMMQRFDADGTIDTSEVNTPKVKIFYESLVDPVAMQDHLVLDGHAINIWRGQKVDLKSIPSYTKAERARMLADYAVCAQKLNTTTQALQATTWAVWQEVTR